MPGTIEGGRKAAATNKKKYGNEFYANIGRKGGRNGHTGGFASNKLGRDGLTGAQRAKIAGAKGGHISKNADFIEEELLKIEKQERIRREDLEDAPYHKRIVK